MLLGVKKTVKRVLLSLGAMVAVLMIGVGFVFYSAFSKNAPIIDHQAPAPGVEIVKDGFVSVAILDVAPEKVALIDAGNDKEAKAVLAALTQRGLAKSAVVAIFLTHGHPDHTNGCRVFPDAQVYAMKDEVGLIGAAADVTHPLSDGDVSQVGDLRVEAFALPGHTLGSAAFLARGVLFFGDSAGGAKDGTMMPAVRWFSKDPRQNVASLKALEARLQPRAPDVRILAFAHSGPLEGFQPFVSFAASH